MTIRKAAVRKVTRPRAEAVTTHAVADWVRDRIRLGRVVPGQRLVEADIVRDTRASYAEEVRA